MKLLGYPFVNIVRKKLIFSNGRYCNLPQEYLRKSNILILDSFYSEILSKSTTTDIEIGVDPLGFTYLNLDFICYVGLVTRTDERGRFRVLSKKYPNNKFSHDYLKKQIQFEYDLLNFKEYIPIDLVTQNLHEIRGLNAKISGHIDAIMNIENEAEWEEKFEAQSENVKKIYVGSRLIKFILDNVKFYIPDFFDALKMNYERSFVVHRSVSKIVKIYRHDFKKERANLDFSGNCNSSMNGDKEYFEILVKIFVENAYKYSEFPKRIGPKVIISENINEIIIEVHSYGRVIPKTEIPYLFSNGFRSSVNRTAKEGTGMGLYNAKQLARHFNSEIVFTNKEVSEDNNIDLTWNIFILKIKKK